MLSVEKYSSFFLGNIHYISRNTPWIALEFCIEYVQKND
uniref:Uncharacterized protein n=1 Tax=Geobacillus sp. (strain Y4.1MC1) TaxID=581103 RepID=A0A7U3YEY5_GEOS0